MKNNNVCVECNEHKILIKKRGLCSRCYQRLRNVTGGFKNETSKVSMVTENKYNSYRELEFVKNYFTHKNWVYQPALFRFNGEKYSPDFYDGERDVFIEVTGTRQAYHQAKKKYKEFKKYYPKINFEIRQPDGSLLDETGHYSKEWGKFQ